MWSIDSGEAVTITRKSQKTKVKKKTNADKMVTYIKLLICFTIFKSAVFHTQRHIVMRLKVDSTEKCSMASSIEFWHFSPGEISVSPERHYTFPVKSHFMTA